jgi:hypothetical protein
LDLLSRFPQITAIFAYNMLEHPAQAFPPLWADVELVMRASA